MQRKLYEGKKKLSIVKKIVTENKKDFDNENSNCKEAQLNI